VASLIFPPVVTAPALQMQLGMADATTRTEDDTTRRAHRFVVEHVSPGVNGPLLLAVALPDDTDPTGPLSMLTGLLVEHPNVDAVVPAVISDDETTAMVQVIPFNGPQSLETIELVDDLRECILPRYEQDTVVNVLISGVSAGVDFAHINATMLPWIVAVLLASFVLPQSAFAASSSPPRPSWSTYCRPAPPTG
jgi:putative drug exporter of the RND superfamily